MAFFRAPPFAAVGRVAERSRPRMPSARVGARVHSLSSLGLAEAAGLDAFSLEKGRGCNDGRRARPLWLKPRVEMESRLTFVSWVCAVHGPRWPEKKDLDVPRRRARIAGGSASGRRQRGHREVAFQRGAGGGVPGRPPPWTRW